MKRYKADLFCHIVAFTELTVEADTPEQARDIMLADAKKLHTHAWDLQEIEDDSIQLNNNSNLPDEVVEETQS